MQAHLVQFDIAWESKPANYARVEQLLSSAPVRPGDLVVLPELFDTGFSFEVEKNADADSATLAFLQQLARRLSVTIQGSCTAIGPDLRGRNRALIVGPDASLLASYDKIHPFSIGRESERFTGGRALSKYDWVSDDERLCVVPAICYDLRFPELFRAGLTLGAELYAVGANWPAARIAHWRALLIARAIENQSFVLGVNRTGRDPALEYPGNSIAVGPQGEVLAEADARECVLSVVIDPAEVRRWREKFPALRDRLEGDMVARKGPSGR